MTNMLRHSGAGLALRTAPLPRAAPFRAGAAPRVAKLVRATAGETESRATDANVLVGAASLVAPWILAEGPAHAIGREYGILEGQIASLVHPGMMFFLFGASCYAGYLGLQWRHTRELAGEIKELKAQRAPAKVGPDGEAVPAPPSPLDSQIAEKEKVRSLPGV
jgi:hypothetical protein